MQGQEALEQEIKVKSSVGIDVCKSWLDAHVLPAGMSMRVPNTAAGIRTLKRRLAPFEVGLVAVEATGKWHRLLCRSLHASGLAVAVVDPLRVRLFAKAHGILAKTDRLDARVLALFAAVMAPPARPPAPTAMEELKELVGARESAVAEEIMLNNQLAAAEGKFLKRQLARRIARIGQDIKALESEIQKAFAPTANWPGAIGLDPRLRASGRLDPDHALGGTGRLHGQTDRQPRRARSPRQRIRPA